MKETLAAALAAMIVMLAPGPAHADTVYVANLTGGQEVPPMVTAATGSATLTLNTAQTNIHVSITVSNFTNTITASHVHKAMFGQNGGVQHNIGVFVGTIDTDWVSPTAAEILELQSNRFYVNVHSTAFPGGEIRGQVRLYGAMTFGADMTGGQEVGPTGSTATGHADLTLDNDLNLHLEMFATGLSGAVTASHIHREAVGVNGPVVFSIGTFSGTKSADFVLTPTQRDDLLTGLYYVNIHTALFPGGEIRGQIGNTSAADVADRGLNAQLLDIIAFPNPAHGSAVIHYETRSAGASEIGMYNVSGGKLRTLTSGPLEIGRGEVVWDGRDDSGAPVPSGTYYYQLQGEGRREGGRLTLIR